MQVHGANRLAGGLAMATMAIGVVALLASGGGCELAVSDSVPSFTCVPGAPNACPSGAVCVPATHECTPRSGTCTPGASSGCGEGMRCDPQTLRCSAGGPQDASADRDGPAGMPLDSTLDSPDVLVAEAHEPDGPGDDSPDINIPDVTSSDAPTSCPDAGGVTCSCSGQSGCASGICAEELTLTTELYMAIGNGNICTKPCCTSADCTANTVCFGTGRGGN
jgi:hypothetical protein